MTNNSSEGCDDEHHYRGLSKILSHWFYWGFFFTLFHCFFSGPRLNVGRRPCNTFSSCYLFELSYILIAVDFYSHRTTQLIAHHSESQHRNSPRNYYQRQISNIFAFSCRKCMAVQSNPGQLVVGLARVVFEGGTRIDHQLTEGSMPNSLSMPSGNESFSNVSRCRNKWSVNCVGSVIGTWG